MPTDLQLRALNTFHRVVLMVSFGRLGGRAGGMPVLELTTIGRRSGQPHTVMLTSPVQQGETIVVVASRGGDDHHPGMVSQLAWPSWRARGIRRKTETADARTGRDPAGASSTMAPVTAAYQGYADYQAKTDREIPLVLLVPACASQREQKE